MIGADTARETGARLAAADAAGLNATLHWSQALLDAAPVPDPRVERARRHVPMKGEPPSALNPPSGCRFRTRCPIAEERCALQEPPLLEAAAGQRVACHFPGRLS